MKAPSGFTVASSEVYPRLIISMEGRPKQGKSHFALTAPDPICYLNLDSGLEGVVHKFSGDKQVFVSKYESPVNLKDTYPDKDQAEKVWHQFKGDYARAVYSEARTVVVDTATEAHELVRLARFGKLSQVQSWNYGPVNYEFKSLLDEALKNPKVNVIFLHKQKDQYVKDKRTGLYERAGFSGIEYIVQDFMQIFWDDEGPNIEFLDSRHNKDLVGTVITGLDVCNFQTVAMMLMPDVDPSAWV